MNRLRKFPARVSLALLPLFAGGCAILHHAQVGQIDNRPGYALVPFEIKVSEMGVSLDDTKSLAYAGNSRGGDQLGDAAAILSMFQMGPRTGNPVYDQRYAEKLAYQIHEKCPSGRVTGLMSIREMRKYPVISGEIVKITGYCAKARVPAAVGAEDIDEITAALNEAPVVEETP